MNAASAANAALDLAVSLQRVHLAALVRWEAALARMEWDRERRRYLNESEEGRPW